MSKIGKKPIEIKPGVTITITDGVVTVAGPKATMSYALMQGIDAGVEFAFLRTISFTLDASIYNKSNYIIGTD